MIESRVYCSDLAEEGLWNTVSCCPSCHEDADLGYHPLIDIVLIDGREASVCCRCSEKVEQQ